MARAGVCKSNLRQLGLGFPMYVSDFGGRFPDWDHTLYNARLTANPRDTDYGYSLRTGYWAKVLALYVGRKEARRAPIWFCPSYRQIRNPQWYGITHYGYDSYGEVNNVVPFIGYWPLGYALNTVMYKHEFDAGRGIWCRNYNAEAMPRTSRIESDITKWDEALLITEVEIWALWQSQASIVTRSGWQLDHFHWRHRGSMNMLFCDGSVRTQEEKERYQVYFIAPEYRTPNPDNECCWPWAVR